MRMGEWIFEQLVLQLSKRNLIVGGAKVLISFTFKETVRT